MGNNLLPIGMEKKIVYPLLALACAIWFLLTGWLWAYLANLFIAYPVAVLGFYFWRKGKGVSENRLNKIAGWLLIVGLIVSVASLFVFR
jgi:hypothetical protein